MWQELSNKKLFYSNYSDVYLLMYNMTSQRLHDYLKNW